MTDQSLDLLGVAVEAARAAAAILAGEAAAARPVARQERGIVLVVDPLD